MQPRGSRCRGERWAAEQALWCARVSKMCLLAGFADSHSYSPSYKLIPRVNTMKLLHIDSSVLGPHSVSRQVSAAIVDRLRKAAPGLEIVHRDLTATPLGRGWANIGKRIWAGCWVSSASPSWNSFQPTGFRSGRSIARRRSPAPCKPQPIFTRRKGNCDTACRRWNAGGGRVSLMRGAEKEVLKTTKAKRLARP